MKPERRNSVDTWQLLEARGEEMPRRPDGTPDVPDSMPRSDDEFPRLSFYKMKIIDRDFSGLTLARTFFGRSLLERVSFKNTDLSESRMCWNDFVACDFTDADLTGCDMRAAAFINCNFTGATLRNADLRRSNIEGCQFTNTDLAGVVADNLNNDLPHVLEPNQKKIIQWHTDPGPEPEGG